MTFENNKAYPSNKKIGSLAEILIDLDRLNHNLHQFAGKHELAPVVKSNAYGHGLKLVTKSVGDRDDVPFVCVAALREAKQLREANLSVPVVIIGYTPTEAIVGCEFENVAFAISSLQQLQKLDNQLRNQRRFHLNIDTGMHRYGVAVNQLSAAIDIIAENDYINITGTFSHFSDAFQSDNAFTQTQIDRWNKAVEQVTAQLSPEYLHMAATSGHFYRSDISANTERIGIGIYGITDYASDLDLRPALSLRSIVAGTKAVSARAPIGYNRSYTADSSMRVGVIPVGYYEGVDRRLSNHGMIRIGDRMCPIVGKVSMNATMVDITHTPDIDVGDMAEVISANPDAENSILNIAREIGTIPYEILTHLPDEITRKTVDFDT